MVDPPAHDADGTRSNSEPPEQSMIFPRNLQYRAKMQTTNYLSEEPHAQAPADPTHC
jgi:hypothetical protein